MKPTFKIHRPTGQYRSFDHSHMDVKVKKKECGTVYYNSKEGKYRLQLAVVKESTEEEPAPFRNITLKIQFDSLDDAKVWITEHFSTITSKYNLYFFD